MSSTTPIMSAAELSDIRDRVARVENYLKQSTASWLKISQEFASAREKLKTLAFQKFVVDCGFTTAVADKLVKIGNCKSLYASQNSNLVSLVDGWTTLYELTKLQVKQFADLNEACSKQNIKRITRRVISNVKMKQPIKNKLLLVATIEIDECYLNKISAEQFGSIQKAFVCLRDSLNSVNAGFTINPRQKVVTIVADHATANSMRSAASLAA